MHPSILAIMDIQNMLERSGYSIVTLAETLHGYESLKTFLVDFVNVSTIYHLTKLRCALCSVASYTKRPEMKEFQNPFEKLRTKIRR